MKLEDALKTDKLTDARQKADLNILYTASRLKIVVNRRYREYGLTFEQANVLRILRGSHPKPLCRKDIAQRMIDRTSNVTRIVDKLAARGKVVKGASQSDRREIAVSLTEEGLELIERLIREVDVMEFHRSSLTDEEAATLHALIEKRRSSLEPEAETGANA
ncbi:MAG: MarR family transcriptional regulator [Bacteroidia bacterium]|nr:MarR family transcriptional regulator [Bacteroidia bacterium]MDW8333100.1 MarR family transcriptional regulator [Bacteroidia bacterium]